jgi:hypothetical protein
MTHSLRCTLTFLLTVLLGLGALLPVHADWREHQELPPWARRGVVQWGHGGNIKGRIQWTPGGFGVDVPNINLILYCGCNVQQTIGYTEDAARQIGEAAGVVRQPYICSKTIWWRSEMPKAPQLQQCLVLKPDGSTQILYGNPERYGGCYSSPIWLEYMKQRIRDCLATQDKYGKIESIFFDNASDYDCYCAVCRAKFRDFTREHLGQEMDLSQPKAYPNFAYAKALFNAEMAVRFFNDLKAYLATLAPGVIISPNIGIDSPWSPYLVSHGATEMLFCERGFSMPPFETSTTVYKVGLADTHGMVVGEMLGLPEDLRRERALILDPGNEAGIQESFYYPEEHKLAMAEALACDGTYVQSFALREQKITANDEPYQVQVRDALHQYSAFWKAHPEIYKLAQPGAKVAVLHGIYSQLADRWQHQRWVNDTCSLLSQAGIPYEVINEEDLQPRQLAAYRLLITANVRLLSVEQAQVLAQWVRDGGTLVQLGDLAQYDLRGVQYPADSLPEIGRLQPNEQQLLGKGRTLRLPGKSDEFKAAEFGARLEALCGPLPCRIKTSSPRVFANLLRTADGRTTTVHLVNSDFTYDTRPSRDLRDDDGLPEARTYFASTLSRARKTLIVPDLAAVAGYDLKFYASTAGVATNAFSFVVSLNGRDLATYKGSQLNQAGWFHVPIPAGLLRNTNEVVFRAEGSPNGHPDWVALKIDTSATTRRSSWSNDSGQTWTESDLSLDTGTQQGELLVRLGPHEDPNKVATVADFVGKLHVHPARDIQVQIEARGQAPVGRLLSPEGVSLAIRPTQQGRMAAYRIPEVSIYSVLVLPGL